MLPFSERNFYRKYGANPPYPKTTILPYTGGGAFKYFEI